MAVAAGTELAMSCRVDVGVARVLDSFVQKQIEGVTHSNYPFIFGLKIRLADMKKSVLQKLLQRRL